MRSALVARNQRGGLIVPANQVPSVQWRLQVALADAVTAERITAGAAAALRTQLALLTERRPWWRRWFR